MLESQKTLLLKTNIQFNDNNVFIKKFIASRIFGIIGL
jgi:hypothetical protein